MNAKQFIELLGNCHPDDEVKAYDPNTGEVESVTGITYGGKDRIVEIYTDEP